MPTSPMEALAARMANNADIASAVDELVRRRETREPRIREEIAEILAKYAETDHEAMRILDIGLNDRYNRYFPAQWIYDVGFLPVSARNGLDRLASKAGLTNLTKFWRRKTECRGPWAWQNWPIERLLDPEADEAAASINMAGRGFLVRENGEHNLWLIGDADERSWPGWSDTEVHQSNIPNESASGWLRAYEYISEPAPYSITPNLRMTVDYWLAILSVAGDSFQVAPERRPLSALESNALHDALRIGDWQADYGAGQTTYYRRPPWGIVREDGKLYADTGSIDQITTLEGMGPIEHMGFGYFKAETPEGMVNWDRGGKEFKGQSGRSHIFDGPGVPWVLERLSGARSMEGVTRVNPNMIQSVMLPRSDRPPEHARLTFTRRQAQAWLRRHDFRDELDPSSHYWHARQTSVEGYKRFRLIPFHDGIQAVYGIKNPCESGRADVALFEELLEGIASKEPCYNDCLDERSQQLALIGEEREIFKRVPAQRSFIWDFTPKGVLAHLRLHELRNERGFRVNPGLVPSSLAGLAEKAGLLNLASWLRGLDVSTPVPPVQDEYLTTEGTRRRANVQALRILRQAQDARTRTGALPALSTQDRGSLRLYSGWGGIEPEKIPTEARPYLTPDQQEYLRINDLRLKEAVDLAGRGRPALLHELTPFGHSRNAFAGLIHQYFTPVWACIAMTRWALTIFDQLAGGRRPIRILEPSAGVGRFLRAWETIVGELGAGAQAGALSAAWTAVEADPDLADVLALLYPSATVQRGAFESYAASTQDVYDLVLGNPPYAGRGEYARLDPAGSKWSEAAHYFAWRIVTMLAPRGVACLLVPSGLVDGKDAESVHFRSVLLRHAHFASAIQLPAVGDGALFPGALLNIAAMVWVRRPQVLLKVLDSDRSIQEGRWFEQNPQAVMGAPQGGHYRPEAIKGTWEPDRFVNNLVRAPEAFDELATPAVVRKPIARPRAVASQAGISEADGVALGETLGYRLALLRDAQNDPERAQSLQGELATDCQEWRRTWGDPTAMKVTDPSPSWTSFLSAWVNEDLAPILTVSMQPAKVRYTGPKQLPDLLQFMCARYETVHTAELAALMGRQVQDQEVLLVADAFCDSAGPGPLRWWRKEEFFTGELWPKYDWCTEVLAGRLVPSFVGDVGAGFREKVEKQKKHLLEAIDPQPIHSIAVGIRSKFVHGNEVTDYEAPALLDFFNEILGCKLEKVFVQQGLLTVVGTLSTDGAGAVMYFNRQEQGKEGEAKKKRRATTKSLEGRIEADRILDLRFAEWLRTSKYAEEVEERYNRAYAVYVERVYSDEPMQIGRIADITDIRPHLWSCLRRAVERRGGIEALDVGLGKTILAFLVIALLRQRGEIRRPMVVAPNSVGPNWLAEFALFLPTFRVVPIGFTVSVGSDGSITSVPDEPPTIQRKLMEFAQGIYDVAVVQQSTFLAFGLKSENALDFFHGNFEAVREAELDRQSGADDDEKIKELEKQLRFERDEGKIRSLKMRLAKLQVSPMLELYAKDLKKAKDKLQASEEGRSDLTGLKLANYIKALKKEVKALTSEIEHLTAKGAPTARKRATDEQAFQKWIDQRIPQERKIQTPTWEDLHVDLLVVDEAHGFKNLYGPASRYGRKAKYMGAMAQEAVVAKCWDLWLKAGWLRSHHNDTGVILLTATPLKNSPLEVYNLLCYVSSQVWERRGIFSPEDFIDRYCSPETEPVLVVGGGFKEDLAVRRFVNLHELRTVYATFVDVKMAIPIEEYDKRKLDGEVLRNIVPLAIPVAHSYDHTVPMDPVQEAIYEPLRKRALAETEKATAALCKRAQQESPKKGQAEVEEEEEDEGCGPKMSGGEILKMMDVMKKAALDPFLLVGRPEEEEEEEDDDADTDEEGNEKKKSGRKKLTFAKIEKYDRYPPKYYELARIVGETRGNCAFIVFSDYTATHERIAGALVELAGLSRSRIRTITGELDPGERQDVARLLNGVWDKKASVWKAKPEIDCVIGTTGSMGEGLNIQTRACAIVHLNLTWEPASIQQRNGRGCRQGNLNHEISIHYLITNKSFDGYMLALTKGKRDWMRDLLESSARSTNNPGADLVGPCAILEALSADPVKAKEYCNCLQNAATEKVLLAQKEEAWKLWGAMVSYAFGARKGGERADYYAQQARSLKDRILSLPPQLVPVRNMIDRALEITMYWDLKSGIVILEGTPIYVSGLAALVERIDPEKGMVTIRFFGKWVTSTLSYAELETKAKDGQINNSPDPWPADKDREKRTHTCPLPNEIKWLSKAMMDEWPVIDQTVRHTKWFSNYSAFPFFEKSGKLRWIQYGLGDQKVVDSDAVLLKPSEGDTIIEAIRRAPINERIGNRSTWMLFYEDYTDRKYPKDLREETIRR